MEHNQNRKVAVDRRAISHLPGPFVLNERARIENVGRVRQPGTLDPRGIDNVDRESSQAWIPDIVPVGFDGVRNACEKIVRDCLFRYDAYSVPEMPGLHFRTGYSQSLLNGRSIA